MLTMAKTPKKKPLRVGKPLHVWLPEELRAAIDKQAEREERGLKMVVVRALREYLERHGKTEE